MEFKHYCEIDNSYRTKTINEISEQGFSGGDWVVELKVHGSNFSMSYDGTDFKCAKKSSFIGDDDNFYGCKAVVEKYKDKVIALFNHLKNTQENVNCITLFGEIFGGTYPHPDVPRVNGAVKVQSGIYYCPWNDVYMYDIQVNNTGYMNVDERNKLLDTYGFLYAKPLFRGSFKEVLEYSNLYPDPLSGWLGLPPIENNTNEGNVLKPVEAKFFYCGSRVILKNKNDKWSEKSKVPRIKEEIVLTERGTVIYNQLLELVTEARLHNVVSHDNIVFSDKDFGKILGLYNVDMWAEFNKDNAEIFAGMDKKEEQKIKKTIGKDIANIIRENFQNILDGNF